MKKKYTSPGAGGLIIFQPSLMVLLLAIFTLMTLSPGEAAAANGFGSLISPGDLAAPHAEYEGLNNCTECHKLRGGVPDKKCLDCHDKLRKRILKNEGIHAKFKRDREPCIQCHLDHRGRDFEMINLSEEKFDHDITGYELTGKHADTKCLDCHTKIGTYTGLNTACISCHDDIHDEQFKGKVCEECHTTESWVEVPEFDHNRDSKYKLTGKHTEIKCSECHKATDTKPYGRTAKFKPIGFKTCNSADCHQNPHEDQFKGDLCKSCHVTAGWEKLPRFNHNKDSRYKLTGKHAKTKCAKCHVPTDGNEKSYGLTAKFKPIEFKACDSADCHQNPHKDQFKGEVCKSCHITKSWKSVDKFDHNKDSEYKLTGKHLKTKCSACHPKRKTKSGKILPAIFKPIEFNACNSADCHGDPHKGQFKDDLCSKCHVTGGWDKIDKFDHDRDSEYKLTGKHAEAKCADCHIQKKNEARLYKPIDPICYECHQDKDVHKGDLGEVCDSCHTTKEWETSTLDHNKDTEFPIVGAHKDAKCAECHPKKDKYSVEKFGCVDCHEDIHKGEFDQVCSSCHTQFNWEPRKFDHELKTNFKLEGVHNDIVCESCHVTKGSYRGVPTLCEECHTEPHFNQFGKASCTECHTSMTWAPTKFSHSLTGLPTVGGHRVAECQACHQDRIYRATSTICMDCHRDDYVTAPNHVTQAFDENCSVCHGSSFSEWIFDHTRTGINCADCHLNRRPATHIDNPIQFPADTCQACHSSTTNWANNHHISASTDCAACHTVAFTPRSQDHATYNWNVCEACHISTTLWTNRQHINVSNNCASCHDSALTPRSQDHTTYNWNVCESCHISTTLWTNRQHINVTNNCASCHDSALTPRSQNHTTYNWNVCESCHVSTTLWSSRQHINVTNNCASCHTTSLTPRSPNHTTYGWNVCETCHTSTTTWSFLHPSISAVCEECHFNYSTPERTPKHTTENWTVCKECHNSLVAWPFVHPTVTNDCASCHTAARPVSHLNDQIRYPNICENCHTSTASWLTRTHIAATTGCVNCHAATKPQTHLNDPTRFPNVCEECHTSTTSWAPRTHITTNNNCSACHQASPIKPVSHTTNNWTICEECHDSTVIWSFTHPFTTFPLNHRGINPNNCEDCHPGGNFASSGNCIICHQGEGVLVHETNQNSVCLTCHSDGR